MANSLGPIGFLVVATLSLCFQSSQGLPTEFFRFEDRRRFEGVFEKAFAGESDLETMHWAANGLKLLEKDIPNSQKACAFLEAKIEAANLESIFHASSISKILGNCKLSNVAKIETKLTQILENSNSPVKALYHATLSQANLGIKMDGSALQDLLEKEIDGADSAESASLLWLAAVSLPGNPNLKPYIENVEDILQQGDESDTTIQFSEGLGVTSLFVRGALGLAAKSGTLPPGLNTDNIGKFAEYFIQNKYVATTAAAYDVLSALDVLANNGHIKPLVLTVFDSLSISENRPNFKVKASDLMGNKVEELNVRLASASLEDKATHHVTNKAMTSLGNSDYGINFWETKPGSGIYTVLVNAEPKEDDGVLVPVKEAKFLIKVVVKVTVEGSELQIIDKEQSLVAKTIRLEYPKTSGEKVEVDHHQKIVMKFTLKDIATNTPITAHQTFVQMIHADSNKEIFFVAEPNDDNEYKFDLDVGASGDSSFGSLSGKYDLSLIIGDAVIENPFSWTFGAVNLRFSKEPSPKQPKEFFKARPEIHHVFREPEPRPPAIVTSVFVILVLTPILVLLISWLALGANLRGLFHTGLSGILFAVGLAALLALLFLFWLRLNMFDTLKYLSAIGLVTAFFGQRMLRQIAESKKE
ncbi:dolichyl-diphosphooligosaccharide--protein glycosyltransferase subunit 2-like [Oscarella lobularis]|uniref:dolichyl-diphosphooligosaccharide--protein glycosyltransferase subunit 2-like n=1 Tax=Oscarella lobularis TaxID=121494 RepID=UPI003313E473